MKRIVYFLSSPGPSLLFLLGAVGLYFLLQSFEQYADELTTTFIALAYGLGGGFIERALFTWSKK